ncbi:hypothetical protein ACHAWT_009097 [Skeletonema menzelii]
MVAISPPTQGPSGLKAAQLSAVTNMLALSNNNDADNNNHKSNSGGSNNTYGQQQQQQQQQRDANPWKLLIYDKHTRSIISPLLSVSQLRSNGVTLHLLLNSDREPIPDVPAVYFVQPTQENLSIIARDCSRNLYERAHLHFSTRIDRPVMEEFARLVVNTGGLSAVASVHDQFVDFVCLENNLFSLNVPQSYCVYNNPGATEQDMELAMGNIATGLFSVVATLGCVPVIRCPRGGAPEMVARKLCKLIAEHPTLIRSKDGLHKSHNRPVLVIMDRNMDLITPVQHASTYQALVDDVLDHKANRVEFNVKQDANTAAATAGSRGRAPPVVRKKLDIDPDMDPFYSQHKFNPFPEAIESNGAELQEVSAREQQIRSKTGGAGTTVAAAVVSHHGGGDSNELATAVESLPVLLDRKKKLEVHTSILQAVMNEVAARDVPQFYELETSLATGSYKNDPSSAKKEVIGLVADPSKGNVNDKVRLVIVYALSNGVGNTSDIDEVAQAMKESLETKGSTISADGAAGSTSTAAAAGGGGGGGSHGTLSKEDRALLESGLRAIDYLKKLRSMHMIPTMSSMMQTEVSGGNASSGSDMLSSFMARATNQATGLLAKATDKLGTMLGKTHKHRSTIAVENICEMRPNTEDDEYLYLDPRVKGDVDVAALRNAARAPVREAIAFMIGGGCYGEYQNLQMVANDRRSITYGSTEIVDPSTFLNHLAKLA